MSWKTRRLSTGVPAQSKTIAGLSTSGDGTPVQQFTKDAIRVGAYRHPVDSWEMVVTPQDLQQWAATFNAMKANGVRVPLVEDHYVSAATTLGYVDDMYADGDVLMFNCTVEGAEQIAAVKRIDQVSINIERDCVDGKGVEYGPAITHIALTPIPVVPGQSSFETVGAERIAASMIRRGRPRKTAAYDPDVTRQMLAMDCNAPRVFSAAGADQSLDQVIKEQQGNGLQTEPVQIKLQPDQAQQLADALEVDLSDVSDGATLVKRVSVAVSALRGQIKAKNDMISSLNAQLKEKRAADDPATKSASRAGTLATDDYDPDVTAEMLAMK